MAWIPSQRTDVVFTRKLVEGVLVIHNRRPMRVVRVRDAPIETWLEGWKREAEECQREARSRGLDDTLPPMMEVVGSWVDNPMGGQVAVLRSRDTRWHVLPEHFSVCRICSEIPPCRHVEHERLVARETAHFGWVMELTPEHCHGCGNPATKRHAKYSFEGPNVMRPDLPDGSAVFHLSPRKGCRDAMESYDRRRAELYGVPVKLMCEGTATCHADGSVTCSAGDGCPDRGREKGLVKHRALLAHHASGGVEGGSECWCLKE